MVFEQPIPPVTMKKDLQSTRRDVKCQFRRREVKQDDDSTGP